MHVDAAGAALNRPGSDFAANPRGLAAWHDLLVIFPGPVEPPASQAQSRISVRSSSAAVVSSTLWHGPRGGADIRAGAADHRDNSRIRWRYDPAHAGVSAQFADCGIHALHLAGFVTGEQIKILSADFASCIPDRNSRTTP